LASIRSARSDQILDVGYLEDGNALRLQEGRDAAEESVEIGDVGVGAPGEALARQGVQRLLQQLLEEESTPRRRIGTGSAGPAG